MASNGEGTDGKWKRNRNGPVKRDPEKEMQPHKRVLGKKGPMCPATCGYPKTERACP